MELALKLSGILLIGLSLLHLAFPRCFDWKQDLASLSLINRQIMCIHTFFIGLMVSMMGLLCLTSAELLSSTVLGQRVCFGMGLFWLVRLWMQFFGFSSELWRGKRLETAIHILFILTWTWLAGMFLAIAGR